MGPDVFARDETEIRLRALHYLLAGQLNARDAIVSRQLPDGRVLDLMPLYTGTTRLGVSRDPEADDYDGQF